MKHQQKLRKSFKWWLMRKVWIYPKRLSLWAGKKLIAWSCEADKLDNE